MSRASVRSAFVPVLAIVALALPALPRPAAAQVDQRPPVLRIQTLEPGLTYDLSRPPESQYVSADTVAMPADSVWLALPGVYRDLGFEQVGQEPSTWTVGSGVVTLRKRLGKKRLSSYLRCGSTMMGSNADRYDVRLSVLTQLERLDAGHTVVRSSLQATATPRARSAGPVECSTRGTLEAAIAHDVPLREIVKREGPERE